MIEEERKVDLKRNKTEKLY